MLAKEIGERIRKLRTAQGITLESLSAKTGMTTGYLSKVERGLSSLPIATLGKVIAALQIQFSEIFGEQSSETRLSILLPEDREVVYPVDRNLCYYYEPLASQFKKKSMEPFIVNLRPHCVEKRMFEHRGEEIIFLLQGKMDFFYGSEVHLIDRVGTCLYFDASVPHKGQCYGDEDARFLAVINSASIENTVFTESR
jgi:transcriptional regulator with XRE-family HTH domain